MPGKTETLTIQGMHCGHCIAAVRSALEDLPGLRVEDVSMGTAQISYDPEKVTHEQIRSALDDEGYPVMEFMAVQ